MASSLLCAASGLLSSPPRAVALPFASSPSHLDGSLAGDFGFDPLGLSTPDNLERYRDCELRHARLAMVAAWGWPVAEGGLTLAKAAVPPASVCSGNGCGIDSSAAPAALQLADIGVISLAYWGALLLIATAGELNVRSLRASPSCEGRPVFDPLRLWVDADEGERRRLELAEVKHGRLAMIAVGVHWSTKLAAAAGSAAAATAAGVPPRGFTFAHQLWGETCVYNVMRQSSVCLPQATSEQFDFVLSWEIMFRTLTGYFREPYF